MARLTNQQRGECQRIAFEICQAVDFRGSQQSLERAVQEAMCHVKDGIDPPKGAKLAAKTKSLMLEWLTRGHTYSVSTDYHPCEVAEYALYHCTGQVWAVLIAKGRIDEGLDPFTTEKVTAPVMMPIKEAVMLLTDPGDEDGDND